MPSKDQFLSERKKSGRSPDSALAATSISGRNFVCLTFEARPSHRLAIVRAAENHFRAVNDNHDIANRRIPITPDLDFRRSVFAGHRSIFPCPEKVYHCRNGALGDGARALSLRAETYRTVDCGERTLKRYRSRASFRRPQCVSLREESNVRSTWRFKPRNTPMHE